MKTILLIILNLFAGIAFSQNYPWVLILNGNLDVIKVQTLTIDKAVMVGSSGSFYRTNTGGITWDTAVIAPGMLIDVKFTDTEHGLVCGENGILMRTENGGNSWDILNAGTTLFLTDITIKNNFGFIAGDNQGLAVPFGDTGVILKTSDSGQTFTVYKTFDRGIKAVSMISGDTCFAVANAYHSPQLIKTTDGGNNWDVIYSGAEDYFEDIKAFENGIIYAASKSYFYKSFDYGTTWDSIQLDISQGVDNIDFPTPDYGFTAGNSLLLGYGTNAYESKDSGQNWSRILSASFDVNVIITDQHDTIGYSVSSSAIYKMAIFSGVSDKNQKNVISPNPFTDHICINSISDTEKTEYKIFDIAGRLVREGKTDGNITGLGSLLKGLYVLKVGNGNWLIIKE